MIASFREHAAMPKLGLCARAAAGVFGDGAPSGCPAWKARVAGRWDDVEEAPLAASFTAFLQKRHTP